MAGVWGMAESVDRAVDVLVAGAGPTGLAMACELRRQGVECLVVDADDGPTPLHESRALAIHASTMEVFHRLGVADPMVAQGRPVHGLSVYHGTNRIMGFRLALSPDETRYPYILSLPQGQTERILIERLGELGGEVAWSTRLSSFKSDVNGVTAVLKGPSGGATHVRARWLIGCDGPRSVVRHALGLSFAGGEYPERFLLADVRLHWPMPTDEGAIVLTSDGPFLSIPLPESGWWRLIDATGAVEVDEPDAIVARFREMTARVAASGTPAMFDEVRWASSFLIHRRIVDRYRAGRCFVVGDAAHLHSPAGGQGMNIGVQDAVNLAWKLALVVRGEGREEILDSYNAERRPVAERVLRGTDWLTRVLTLRNPVARGVRNALLGVLSGVDAVRRKLSRELSELSVSYRKSPIVGEAGPGWLQSLQQGGATAFHAERAFRRGPRPGDRMPDLLVSSSDPWTGQEQRLSDVVFRTETEVEPGVQHVLLLFQGTEPESGALETEFVSEAYAPPHLAGRIRPILVEPKVPVEDAPAWKGERLADPTNALHRRFGAVGACLYLIRPDGYIGFRAQPMDALAFREYLKRIFR